MPGRVLSAMLSAPFRIAGRLPVGPGPSPGSALLSKWSGPPTTTATCFCAPAAFSHVPQLIQVRPRGLNASLGLPVLPSRTLWNAAGPFPTPPRRSLFSRVASFLLRAFLFTALGAAIASGPFLANCWPLRRVSDAETLTMVKPEDPGAQAKEDYINAHPLVVSLRADPLLTESRPHLKIPPIWRAQTLMGGTLLGPGRIAIPPLTWSSKDGKRLVQIIHVGPDMCGHVGIVHGGFLATVLDEGLGRCCFPVLPQNVGMTASLQINYKAPAKADQFLVLRATTTKVDGRKAWVEGHLETLPDTAGEQPTVVATASALFISPKQALRIGNYYV